MLATCVHVGTALSRVHLRHDRSDHVLEDFTRYHKHPAFVPSTTHQIHLPCKLLVHQHPCPCNFSHKFSRSGQVRFTLEAPAFVLVWLTIARSYRPDGSAGVADGVHELILARHSHISPPEPNCRSTAAHLQPAA